MNYDLHDIYFRLKILLKTLCKATEDYRI